jgi:BirA family biotin operon repressor/biotin-[acetyl-CoA-carboxylase] ligase
MPEAPATWGDDRLRETRFTDVRWFSSLDSTNRYLLDEAARGAPEGVVAVADEQHAGRGRHGRTWVAPKGASLLVSVLVRPRLAADRRHLVTLAAAAAAADAVASVAGVQAAVKWPNDLVVADRKLAGILAEATADAVVVGMGLNVQWDAFPDELAPIATACNLCGDRSATREDLLVAWLQGLDARLDGIDAVLAEVRGRSATLGRRVRVELDGGSFVGDAVDLDPAGHLVVRGEDGEDVVVAAGDVVHLRAQH